jgi:hypothetical protein
VPSTSPAGIAACALPSGATVVAGAGTKGAPDDGTGGVEVIVWITVTSELAAALPPDPDFAEQPASAQTASAAIAVTAAARDTSQDTPPRLRVKAECAS